jgi:hypothetical protein
MAGAFFAVAAGLVALFAPNTRETVPVPAAEAVPGAA